jgi:hypothetical protein
MISETWYKHHDSTVDTKYVHLNFLSTVTSGPLVSTGSWGKATVPLLQAARFRIQTDISLRLESLLLCMQYLPQVKCVNTRKI